MQRFASLGTLPGSSYYTAIESHTVQCQDLENIPAQYASVSLAMQDASLSFETALQGKIGF